MNTDINSLRGSYLRECLGDVGGRGQLGQPVGVGLKQ